MDSKLIFPRPDKQTAYLKNVTDNKSVIAGDFSIYNDFENDPADFVKNNVLYHYPVNGDKLIIGKFCSIGCGTKFLFTSGNHSLSSLANYAFPVFFDEWGMRGEDITKAWDNKGDTVLGNDVWTGYHSIIMQGVHIGDGAVIGAGALVTKDVRPYSVVAGVPAKEIKMRFDEKTIERLLEIKWWDKPEAEIQKLIPYIISGDIDKL